MKYEYIITPEFRAFGFCELSNIRVISRIDSAQLPSDL